MKRFMTRRLAYSPRFLGYYPVAKKMALERGSLARWLWEWRGAGHARQLGTIVINPVAVASVLVHVKLPPPWRFLFHPGCSSSPDSTVKSRRASLALLIFCWSRRTLFWSAFERTDLLQPVC